MSIAPTPSAQKLLCARPLPVGEVLQIRSFLRYPWLVHGFTTARGQGLAGPGHSKPSRTQRAGLELSFNLSYSVGDDPRRVERNRRRLLEALGASAMRLITLGQRHTDVIETIHTAGHLGRRQPDGSINLPGDAVITNQPGLLLSVQVADCFPILLVDPRHSVVAAVHAGWRGTLEGIAEKAVGRMRQEFGSDPAQMRAAVGPGIQQCCYEVGGEVADAFRGRFRWGEELLGRMDPSAPEVHWQPRLFREIPLEAQPRPSVTSAGRERFRLNLREANRRQLLATGLKPTRISSLCFCTACRTDRFFSHRGEQGRTGRMMGVVGILPQLRSGRLRKAR